MVGESSHAGGRAEDLSLGKPAAPESKPKPAKPKKKKKAVKEKPEVVEKVETPVETEKVEVTEDEVSHEVSDEDIDTDSTEDSQVTDVEESEVGGPPHESESNSRAVEGSQEMGEGFVQLEDGAWAAKNQGIKGLSYGFLAQPEPEYPAIARKMGVDHEVIIRVRFLIGYKGRVEDIKFYDDVTNFGFREEVEKTLKNWRATPIEVDGRKIKLYFYKTFRFEKLG
jgi:protein TonB